ncbi:DUF2267 domain-containing protein [Thermobifida cellulosilytica]|uniref:DUF2267 domain-containing protein n=1 Tax=Thermobifida cellulosilytica TB100 TaxID=665004 RepID=A0A147KI45_THECS|nr:DUF2267 domain-containing protein [Thermobifida cellulosilytica]KUP96972.1 hypothetical protein AC529_09395 [Thermobifida cellulosilytica TB100]
MIAHQDLVDRVAAHEEVADAEEARRAVHAVLAVLAPRLAPEARRDLRRELPKSLWEDLDRGQAEPAAASGSLARRVGEHLHCPPEQGLRLARAVVSELALASPVLGREMAASLPEDLAQWSRDPTGARGDAEP